EYLIYWKPYWIRVLVISTLIQARQYLDAFALALHLTDGVGDNLVEFTYNREEQVDGVCIGRSIGSILCSAVTMIRLMQQLLATRKDIIAFIKKRKPKSHDQN
ncbi:MAG: hypothetical protein V7K27_24775, partial [Nostoc sp.]